MLFFLILRYNFAQMYNLYISRCSPFSIKRKKNQTLITVLFFDTWVKVLILKYIYHEKNLFISAIKAIPLLGDLLREQLFFIGYTKSQSISCKLNLSCTTDIKVS